MPGRRSFTIRGYARADPNRVMGRLLRDVAPKMEERGYRITQRSDGRLRFERDYRRGVLRRRRRESVMIDVDETSRGTRIVAMGVAPRAVRRLMRHLGD